MNPPEMVVNSPGFWGVLVAGMLLGAIVYSLIGVKPVNK